MSFAAVATVLRLLHLFAFGLYALSVVSYEFASRADLRRVSSRSFVTWSAVCLQFSPGLLIRYASMQPGRIPVTSYDNLIIAKVYALFAPFIFGLVPTSVDLLLVALILSFLAVTIVTRSLKIAPEMRLPIAAMTAISLLTPRTVAGSSFVDIRLPVMLPFVIIASTRLEPLRKG